MRLSRYFAPTMKEKPSEAIALSHQLMLRAGLVRMLSAGIYSFLPLGWRAAKKAMGIIREEMDAIGAQELYLPTLNPVDMWAETGRNDDFGEEMFRLQDRKGQTYVLTPTHEEVICSLARGHIRSYRDLPQSWYQIQLKFRDEPRPRGGMLRMRCFLMKDSYSLDRDEEGLDGSYNLHREAYEQIFQRCGLNYFIVGASSGLMGGGQSEEFMVESAAGEDQVVRCEHCGYAANLEVATSDVAPVEGGESTEVTEVATPQQRTVDEVSSYINIPPHRLIKTLIYMTSGGLVMALIAGDDELSESKLSGVVRSPVRPAHPQEVRERMGTEVGFLGPQGSHGLPIYADLRLEEAVGMASGANRDGYHVIGLEFGRDIIVDEYVDLRVVKRGENCPLCGGDMRIVRVLELGHIFKLGTKYSEAMRAYFLDEEGRERPIIMGSYGIGVERILAAAIEQDSDEDGIRWNSALAPMEVMVIPLNSSDEQVMSYAERIYEQLLDMGYEVLLDDRNVRTGVKMKDADLIGIPVHVIISARNIAEGQLEVKNRWDGEQEFIAPEDLLDVVDEMLEENLPLLDDEASPLSSSPPSGGE